MMSVLNLDIIFNKLIASFNLKLITEYVTLTLEMFKFII